MQQALGLILKLILISLPIWSCSDNNKSKEQELILKEQNLKAREEQLKRQEEEINNLSSEKSPNSTSIDYRNGSTNLSELSEISGPKKYIYVSFEIHNPTLYHSPSRSTFFDGKSSTIPEANLVIWEKINRKSNIIEVANYTEDDKYRLMDAFENEVSFDLRMTTQRFQDMVRVNVRDEFEKLNLLKNEAKINQKECYTFDSYSEASVHRQK